MKVRKTLLASAVAMALAPAAILAEEPGGAGNNLSVPAIWAEGVALIAPITQTQFAGTDQCLPISGLKLETNPFTAETVPPCVHVEDRPGFHYWLQQRFENRWQAETVGRGDPVVVNVIDWGDNLEVVPWYLNSVVRVETVLLKDVSTSPMLGYSMNQLWGQGIGEMHGAGGVQEPPLSAMDMARIYTHCARMGIQKIAELPAEGEEAPELPLDGLDWVNDEIGWTGGSVIDAPLFSKAVYEGGDGPSYYSAEINIGGGVVYGYNWFVNQMNDGTGIYRLTFRLDAGCPDGLNTLFDGATTIAVPAEEEEVALASEDTDGGSDSGAPSGGVAGISVDDQLTYLDLMILDTKGSGKSNPGGNGRKPEDPGPPDDVGKPDDPGKAMSGGTKASAGKKAIGGKKASAGKKAKGKKKAPKRR